MVGIKWCGKTWTSLAHGALAAYVDRNVELAEADPMLILMGDRPHVIDEWQLVPRIWDAVRREVDSARALPDVGFTPVRYYRDDSGLEADAIIELSDGRWAAFEIKLSEAKVPGAIESLKRLRKKVMCENPASFVRPPEFMAVITGNSEYARKVEEGLYVIPIRALGV